MEKDAKTDRQVTPRHLYFEEAFFAIFVMVWYIAGWVFVKGFWGCLFAICFPPYPLYKAVEYFVTKL